MTKEEAAVWYVFLAALARAGEGMVVTYFCKQNCLGCLYEYGCPFGCF